jgi:hypothetical protein
MRFLFYILLFAQLPLFAQEIRVVDYEQLKLTLFPTQTTQYFLNKIQKSIDLRSIELQKDLTDFFYSLQSDPANQITPTEQKALEERQTELQNQYIKLTKISDSISIQLEKEVNYLQEKYLRQYISDFLKEDSLNIIILSKSKASYFSPKIDITTALLESIPSMPNMNYLEELHLIRKMAYYELSVLFKN